EVARRSTPQARQEEAAGRSDPLSNGRRRQDAAEERERSPQAALGLQPAGGVQWALPRVQGEEGGRRGAEDQQVLLVRQGESRRDKRERLFPGDGEGREVGTAVCGGKTGLTVPSQSPR